MQDYGFIDGSKSRVRHPSLNKEKSFSLTTKDIFGAHANAIPERYVHLYNVIGFYKKIISYYDLKFLIKFH